MAQIIGDKLLMFHAATVDSSSTTRNGAGTNVDLAAFPASSISSIIAVENKVEVAFNHSTAFEQYAGADGESILKTYVELTCTSANAAGIVEGLWSLLNSVSAAPVIKFDFVTSGYVQPIEDVTGVVIRRAHQSFGVSTD